MPVIKYVKYDQLRIRRIQKYEYGQPKYNSEKPNTLIFALHSSNKVVNSNKVVDVTFANHNFELVIVKTLF